MKSNPSLSSHENLEFISSPVSTSNVQLFKVQSKLDNRRHSCCQELSFKGFAVCYLSWPAWSSLAVAMGTVGSISLGDAPRCFSLKFALMFYYLAEGSASPGSTRIRRLNSNINKPEISAASVAGGSWFSNSGCIWMIYTGSFGKKKKRASEQRRSTFHLNGEIFFMPKHFTKWNGKPNIEVITVCFSFFFK